MRYTLSNRQEKALHESGEPLRICIPCPPGEPDRNRDLAFARSALEAADVLVIDAERAIVTVQQWTGARNAPQGLGDVLGRIEKPGGEPLRDGYVRSHTAVLVATLHSTRAKPRKADAPLAWPAGFIPDADRP